MIALPRLDGRNAPARTAAVARLVLVPILLLFEALEAPASPHDLAFGEALLAALVVYAIVTALHAFTARAELPLAPLLIADTVLLSLLVCAEGGAVADARYMLLIPVLVAVLGGPRLALGIAALSVVGYVAAAVAHPSFGAEVSVRLLAVHTLDLAWRAGLAVAVSVLLTRRAERIRELAESRRSLVTQALTAEARARRELSYSLHDELVQQLLCAQQDLKVARRDRPEYIDRAEEAIGAAVQQLRREIFRLHPHLLETAGLEAALDAVADQHGLADGGRAVVSVAPDAGGVDDELLFSLGRELLTNAFRHAGAREVALTVDRDDARVVLCCRDDGRGMEPERRVEALAGGHLGLAACTERVEALGGSLAIESAPGRGTVVRASIPAARVAGARVASAAPPGVASAAPAR